jgi:L-threonylcarbamoyladenylate synthase
MSATELRNAAAALHRGAIVAYPTEAVYGLGCDPLNASALQRLLAVKQRDPSKGLILIAATLDQLARFILPLDDALRARVLATWPGPVTWVVPARAEVSTLLRGDHDTLAVRVTAHPVAAALCSAFGGAIVSTSANPSTEPAARTAAEVRARFAASVDFVLDGAVGGQALPTEIRDARSGEILRPG